MSINVRYKTLANFKYLQKAFSLVASFIFLCSVLACGDDGGETFEENMGNIDSSGITVDTSNITVTGSVESCGITYACFKGYANLNLMPTGSGEIGMEICLPNNEHSSQQKTSSSLSDNAYVVEFSNLSPNTEYKYRSFVRFGEVTHYGQYRTFTTKSLSCVAVTGEATNINRTSAMITSIFQVDSIHPKDDFKVGVAYSISVDSFSLQSIDGVLPFHTWGEQSAKDLSDEPYTVSLGFLTEDMTYYYAAFAELEGKYYFGEIKSFTTEKDGFVPYGAVDLGLSVMWASCNLGANSPEEYGGYYAWGETEEKIEYDWDTYKWCKGSLDTMTKYCTDSSEGVVDNKVKLDLEDDVAHVKLDGSWRMPTNEEFEELIEKCTWEWTTCNDVDGQLVTGPNGNSIFLPAAGYCSLTYTYREGEVGSYLSAMLYKGYSSYRNNYFVCLSFDDEEGDTSMMIRDYGCSVRPVTE